MDVTFATDEDLTIPNPWECIKCGRCCQRYNGETKEIDSCQYLQEDYTCGIYEDRPIACKLYNLSNNAKINHCNISIASIELKRTLEEVLEAVQALNKGEARG